MSGLNRSREVIKEQMLLLHWQKNLKDGGGNRSLDRFLRYYQSTTAANSARYAKALSTKYLNIMYYSQGCELTGS